VEIGDSGGAIEPMARGVSGALGYSITLIQELSSDAAWGSR